MTTMSKKIVASFVGCFVLNSAIADVVTNSMGNTSWGDASWGYIVSGLGNAGNETAVVFTNHTAEMSWTVPTDLENVQFLVVGGGGGGGAESFKNDDAAYGGAGGGGGGVVTGLVDFVKGNTVSVTVGAGGAGGNLRATKSGYGTGYGESAKGEESNFGVGDAHYVKAFGGGRDQGVSKNNSNSIPGEVGGVGGSNGGSRGGYTTEQDDVDYDKVGYIASGITALKNFDRLGNKGGKGCSDLFYGYPSAGGGGGAVTPGGDAGNNAGDWQGGAGGEGLASDITGITLVYGSGGGGASTQGSSGGEGGPGAGNGGDRADPQGTHAVANQGGGGGGSSRNTASYGGNGGSGIVVFRYAIPVGMAIVPEIPSKVYDGQQQTADVIGGIGYTVTENNGGTNAGKYNVVLSLTEGYTYWDEGGSNPLVQDFEITQAENAWTTNAVVTKAEWFDNDTAGVITNATTKFGEVSVTVTSNNVDVTSLELDIADLSNWRAGDYVVIFTAPSECSNFSAVEPTAQSVEFSIYSASGIPTYAITLGELAVVGDTVLSNAIPYKLSCELENEKTAELWATYTLADSGVTNTVKIADNVALYGGSGTGYIVNLIPGTNYFVSVYALVDGKQTESATGFAEVTTPGAATALTAAATFTNDPMEFIVYGSVEKGIGNTTATLWYGINSEECTESMMITLNENGAFTNRIAYTSLSDTLVYKVVVSNSVEMATLGKYEWGVDVAATKNRLDTSTITYTWTGNGGDNHWTNILNWSSGKVACYGYPNSSYAKANIATKNCEIDLCGKTYVLRSENGSLKFAKNLGTVTLRNGGLDFNANDSYISFGGAGTDIVFDSVNLLRFRLTFVNNSNLIFEGNCQNTFAYSPWGNTFAVTNIVRNGSMQCKPFQTWYEGTKYAIVITNATLTFTSGFSAKSNPSPGYGIAGKVYLKNGVGVDGQQAKLIVKGTFTFKNTYQLEIPAVGYDEASIMVETHKYLKNAESCRFNIDVTDYRGSQMVPIVKYTSDDEIDMSYKFPKLTCYAYQNGKNVTAKRNAHLIWVGKDENGKVVNTLYYKQDSQHGFTIKIR